MSKEKVYEFKIDGVDCSFTTNFLARKSQTSVLAQMGNTVVLVTANVGSVNKDLDFFPLTVEYLESMYASGKISGSRFRKREGFPTEDATLNRRIIDRTIRPRFPSDFRNETQIIIKVLAYDEKHSPVVLAGNAVSLALMMSKAPFSEPMSIVRVGLNEDGKPYNMLKAVDRDASLKKEESMNMILGGDGESLTNIDAAVAEFPEDLMIESMELGVTAMNPWIEAQKAALKEFGVEDLKGEEYESCGPTEQLVEAVRSQYKDVVWDRVRKVEGDLDSLVEEAQSQHEGDYTKSDIKDAIYKIVKEVVREKAVNDNERIGQRGLDEVRELDYKLDLLPKVHGSALFTRGYTQVLAITTLSSGRDQQVVDDMTGEVERRFFLHYVDAPFVYSDPVGRVKYHPGSRQVGHSALAEKAFYPVLPDYEEFPYTVMVTCEVLEEHGSSSMASATSPSMSLMAAGVPVKKHVAGISMGVMFTDDMENHVLLTDMGESEDFYGFMDFKVAGTRDGVTAIQMDTKTRGLPVSVFKEAIVKAKAARIKIIEDMEGVINAPRANVAAGAPKVLKTSVPEDKIGELIGPGGKNIKALTEETGAEINIEDDGTVFIFAETQESLEAAQARVDIFSFVPEVGEIYEGVVDGLADFGAFVEIAPGVSGLVHISEVKDGFVEDVSEFLSEGDKVKVKLLDKDNQGKLKLSIKAVKA